MTGMVNAGPASVHRRPSTAVALRELRQEYATQGVGARLYSLINRLVASTTRRYPAVIYSPDGETAWSPEGRAAVAHAWAADRLLSSRRSLETALQRAVSTEHFERLLQRDL